MVKLHWAAEPVKNYFGGNRESHHTFQGDDAPTIAEARSRAVIVVPDFGDPDSGMTTRLHSAVWAFYGQLALSL